MFNRLLFTSTIVRGEWKLCWDYESGARRLFHLASDPAAHHPDAASVPMIATG